MKFIVVVVFALIFYAFYLKVNAKNMGSLNNNTSHAIDFSKNQEVSNWRITDDGVMGGRSQGNIKFEQDHGIFSGKISLENNGGFSSTFRAIEPLPNNLNTITIDVEGDGLVYQLRMVTKVDRYRLSYKHNFTAVKGQRQKVTFALSDFQASFRGRVITNAPKLTSDDIIEVGFLINNKKPESFSLSIFNLQFN